MKVTHYKKLSVLLLVLFVLAPVAFAESIGTGSSFSYLGYNATNPAGPYSIASGDGVNVLTISNTWEAPISGSYWITNNAQAGPGGSVVDPNGYYAYDISFSAVAGDYNGYISVLADDTAEVLLNGVVIVNPAIYADGNDGHCATGGGGPTCGNFGDTTSVAWTNTLSSFSLGTTNNLTIIDYQTGGSSAGVDAVFSYESTDVTKTPEPSSLFLMGTGLLGLAMILFRSSSSRAATLS